MTADASGLLRVVERTEMRYPEPERNPRRVRAGSYVERVTVKDPDAVFSDGSREVSRPIFIHTTKVMSHRLAEELRSRAHAYVDAEEAEAS